MNLYGKLSCNDFVPVGSSSSINTALDLTCTQPREESQAKSKSLLPENSSNKCPPVFYTSSISSMSSGIQQQECHLPKANIPKAPNIGYELAVAKSIMQQYSSISEDNLFDHLSDIIKRVIDERPPNVIDFFEEFSRSVREQKFHLPERFPPDAVFEETRMYKLAKKQLISMKLPYTDEMDLHDEDFEEEPSNLDDLRLELKKKSIFRTFTKGVQHLQFYWNQCGFSISSDDIFQLACSMDRLQNHPSITQCRFWGVINGLKASYYIIEATLSKEECESRLLQMEKEILESQSYQNFEKTKEQKLPSHIGLELIPGAVGWENYAKEDLLKMKPEVLPVPLIKVVDVFDVPPEPIGSGLNRYVYFVVNSLSDDWIELPIVTPQQINVSRQIKKFFTGDLEADIVSYPYFPGKEKHYLRAMISRITAGTYIAPTGYYRKMTKKEKHLFEGSEDDKSDDDEEEEEEEESQRGEGEEEGETDNDIVLLKNESYDPSISLNILNNPSKWVHVRPNILHQGGVVWYDEEKAQRKRENERKRLEKANLLNEKNPETENEEEEEESDSEEEDDDQSEEEELQTNRELGPAMLTSCSHDTNNETPVPWVGRFSSKFSNKNERILMMKSNIWPGACTFIFENLCESIYLGWGHKYVSRNMNWTHLAPIAEEYPHGANDFIEAIDPSIEMEEAYRLSLLKEEVKMSDINEHLSDYENETHESNDDEDETEEEQ